MYKPYNHRNKFKFKKKRSFFAKRKTFNTLGSKITARPSFKTRRREKKDYSGMLAKIYISVGLIIVVFLSYLLFFSDIFKVKKIVLVNNNEISQESVDEAYRGFGDQRRFLIFPGDNIFLLNRERLQRQLVEKIPKLRSVDISKKLLDVVKLDIKEKKLSAVWVSGNDIHYIDERGYLCCEARLDEVVEKNLPTIYDQNNRDVQINDEVVTQKFVGFLLELNTLFPEEIKVGIRKFWVPSILSREVHLETIDGWKVYFSIDRTVPSQLNDLKTLINQQIKNNIKNIEYIDLRVENWVYYK